MSVPGDGHVSGSVNSKQIRRVAKSGRAQACGGAKVKCSVTVAPPQHLWTPGNARDDESVLRRSRSQLDGAALRTRRIGVDNATAIANLH